MANTGIRQLTTVVGGYAKRIWYSLNGTTPTNELMSIDDTGKFKCVSQQITGLAGTGTRMVTADSSGNLSANTKLLRGTVGIASGDTVTVTLPEAMPTIDYVVSLSADRGDYNGSVTLTIRDRVKNEFKIHYWAGDGGSTGVHWTLIH